MSKASLKRAQTGALLRLWRYTQTRNSALPLLKYHMTNELIARGLLRKG